MPCLHYDIVIIKRSEDRSTVASAAWQSGERLFPEYDQEQESHRVDTVDRNNRKYA